MKFAIRLRPVFLVSPLILLVTVVPARAQYFREVRSLPVPGQAPHAAAVAADFNGDGIVDLAVDYKSDSTLTGGLRVFLGQGGGAFAPPIDTATAVFGWKQAAVGDFNEDGKTDIAIVAGQFAVLLGDGAGHFTTVAIAGAGTHGIQVADADRDGHLDLLGFDRTTNGLTRLLVFRGNGAGGFAPPIVYGVGFQTGGIAASDLTGDGAVDVMMTDHTVGRVFVMLNNGAGVFGLGAFYDVGAGINRLAIADLNEDTRPDVVVANRDTGALLVMLSTGPGTFGAPITHPGPGKGLAEPSVSTADLDGDGHVDVVVSDGGVWAYRGDGAGDLAAPRRYVATGVASIADLDGDGKRDIAAGNGILINGGGFDFAAPQMFGVGKAPRAVATADLNHDGRADLVTANRDSDDVSVLLGLGNGTFAPAVSITVGDAPQRLALADFNVDNNTDIAVANHDSGNVSILLGTGTGAFVAQAALSVPAPEGVSAADLNEDGRTDLAVATTAGVAVALGNGNGTFAAPVVKPLPTAARSVAVLDLNPDFHRDIVAGMDTSLAALIGIGGAQYLAPAYPFAPSDGSVSTTLPLDFDADASTDVAVATGGIPKILRGDGTGALAPVPIVGSPQVGPLPENGLAAADFTRDGTIDVLSGGVSVLVGNSSAFAVADRPLTTAGAVSALATADFDGDGWPDVAAALRDGAGVEVFLDQPAPPGADIAITVTHAPDPAVPHALLTYTMTVANQGPLPAKAVVASMDQPPGTTLLPLPSNCTATTNQPARVVCSLGDIAASGSAAVAALVTVDATSGTLSARANVEAAEPRDLDPFDNEVVHLVPVGFAPNLSVTVQDSVDPVAPGAPFSYVVQVTNHGQGVASGPSLHDQLPPQVSFVSSVPTCPVNSGTLDCTLPDLSSGQSVTYTFNVVAGSFTSVTNVVTVTVPYDMDLADNQDAEETRVDLATGRELLHGTRLSERFAAGSSDRVYLIREDPYSSYEVVVDALAGDVAAAGGTIQLDRLDESQSVVQGSVPYGLGPSRSLRWENTTSTTVIEEVRVRSTGCGTACDAGDVFRIRAYDTTGRIARFRNVATQLTVAHLQNPTSRDVHGTIWAWSDQGALIGSVPFALQPQQQARIDLTAIVPGRSGTMTVTHDAPYGALVAKVVALEPGLGFTFDTLMLPRPR